GYVALEALSRGTPVLASDVCALPEIVADGACGHLLPFPKDDEIGRWRHLHRTREPDYLDRFDDAIEQLATGIFEAVATGWERRDDYERLSAGALERVRTRFSRTFARDRLEAIYELARR